MTAAPWELAVRFDKWINYLLDGDPTETLSSRAWRMEQKRQPYWGWTRRAIDALFFWERGHCLTAFNTWTAEASGQLLKAQHG